MTLLQTLKPAEGSKRPRLRVGRGASAGQGKTCGRGTKGQRARKGGYHKVGFEGGQTPLDRRLPKFGFRSDIAITRAEVRLHELEKRAQKNWKGVCALLFKMQKTGWRES